MYIHSFPQFLQLRSHESECVPGAKWLWNEEVNHHELMYPICVSPPSGWEITMFQ